MDDFPTEILVRIFKNLRVKELNGMREMSRRMASIVDEKCVQQCRRIIHLDALLIEDAMGNTGIILKNGNSGLMAFHNGILFPDECIPKSFERKLRDRTIAECLELIQKSQCLGISLQFDGTLTDKCFELLRPIIELSVTLNLRASMRRLNKENQKEIMAIIPSSYDRRKHRQLVLEDDFCRNADFTSFLSLLSPLEMTDNQLEIISSRDDLHSVFLRGGVFGVTSNGIRKSVHQLLTSKTYREIKLTIHARQSREWMDEARQDSIQQEGVWFGQRGDEKIEQIPMGEDFLVHYEANNRFVRVLIERNMLKLIAQCLGTKLCL